MARKKTIEDEINAFFEKWDVIQQVGFLRDIIPLFELYDVEDENDWVKENVGDDEDNLRNVRLIRTVYLVSRIADFHASRLCSINIEFKNLWKKMERVGVETKEELKCLEKRMNMKYGLIEAFNSNDN